MGGVYGEEWIDVSGEGGNWEERLKLLGSVFWGRVFIGRRDSEIEVVGKCDMGNTNHKNRIMR